MNHIKYPSIESFHNKVKAGRKYYMPATTYIAKPKLHGTNSSIVVNQYGHYAQSRNKVVTVESDNAGFAAFTHQLPIKVPSDIGDKTIVVYGEWAGQGIQNNDAITKIGRKIFAVFAVVVFAGSIDDNNSAVVYSEPSDINSWLEALGIYSHEDVYVIDVVDTVEIFFSGDSEKLGRASAHINKMVSEYEVKDTWVYDKFGVEGAGEGFVFTPLTQDYNTYQSWAFKAKTESHRTNKSKSASSVQATISPTQEAFVDNFVTDARLNQAVGELGGEDSLDMKRLGEFLAWVNKDIVKESVDELEASGLLWKDVSKLVTMKTKSWFMSKFG